MYTLGINAAYHDSAACLVADGQVVEWFRGNPTARHAFQRGRLVPQPGPRVGAGRVQTGVVPSLRPVSTT